MLFILVIAATAVGYMFFQASGAIIGFLISVIMTGHFITVVNTRDLTYDNRQLLRDLLKKFEQIELPIIEDNDNVLKKGSEPPSSQQIRTDT